MTTSSDDLTTELPEFDATTPLPTIPAPAVGVGTDATTELPASSPDQSSDPLAVFRDAPTTQMPAGSVGAGGRTAFDPASTGESIPGGHEAGAPHRRQEPLGASSAAPDPTPGVHATWSAPAGPVDVRTLPEAPSRGVRVGSFVWALLVCMVGVFLIAEAYVTNFNLPVLGISSIAALGVILILTALFSGRSKKNSQKGAPSAASNPADAIRRD